MCTCSSATASQNNTLHMPHHSPLFVLRAVREKVQERFWGRWFACSHRDSTIRHYIILCAIPIHPILEPLTRGTAKPHSFHPTPPPPDGNTRRKKRKEVIIAPGMVKQIQDFEKQEKQTINSSLALQFNAPYSAAYSTSSRQACA